MKKTDIVSEEHLRKIKHRFAYTINESPRYRQLVQDGDEYDELPEITNEADDEPNKDEKEHVPDITSNVGTDAPAPEFTDDEEIDLEAAIEEPIENEMEPSVEVDEIQNDIIKHNIEAMRDTYDKLESLNDLVQNLNSKLDSLNAEVEEVREPTDGEKLMSKKTVSYPFYMGLNDYWEGNWFEEKNQIGGSSNDVDNEYIGKGIKKMPDGTFVADFDDLPKHSDLDIKKSFDSLI